jgi:hypothetical protein
MYSRVRAFASVTVCTCACAVVAADCVGHPSTVDGLSMSVRVRARFCPLTAVVVATTHARGHHMG